MIQDVVKSSAIAGQLLDAQQVRPALARKLGIDIGGFTPFSRCCEKCGSYALYSHLPD